MENEMNSTLNIIPYFGGRHLGIFSALGSYQNTRQQGPHKHSVVRAGGLLPAFVRGGLSSPSCLEEVAVLSPRRPLPTPLGCFQLGLTSAFSSFSRLFLF